MKIRQKTIKGKIYYYFEESFRIGKKTKTYSLYLGKNVPKKDQIPKIEKKLESKIYKNLIGNKQNIYLSEKELIMAELAQKNYRYKLKKMTKSQRNDSDEIDAINFVYTTLSTEGIPITKQDADFAYNAAKKKIKNIRDENLKIAMDMINGLKYVKKSKLGLSFDFIISLHNIIMDQYNEKNPGKLRKKQAYIYLKSYERVEEIRFRPPKPEKLKKMLKELVKWYNSNLLKLNSIELAALLHLRFYKIHPFEDGNKRMSRLLLNKALFDANYPIINISKDTKDYFDSLIHSVEKEDEKPFVRFVMSKFKDKMLKK